jgi:hypothetical protein
MDGENVTHLDNHCQGKSLYGSANVKKLKYLYKLFVISSLHFLCGNIYRNFYSRSSILLWTSIKAARVVHIAKTFINRP